MRLQRYPDGQYDWILSIWSRHPSSSLTWTHSLWLQKKRKGAQHKRFGVYKQDGSQRHYMVGAFDFWLVFSRQDELLKPVN